MAVSKKLCILIAAVMVGKINTETEPACSKFHFEEKVLEKLVRLEHSTGILKDTIEAKVAEAKQDVNDMKAEFENWRTQVQEAKQMVATKLEEYRNSVQITDNKKRSTYAFSAKTLTDSSPTRNQPLKFKEILMNDHNVYDVSTGKFTAPVNGTFVFTFSLCVNSNKYMSFQIIAGGKGLSREYKHEHDAVGSIASYVVVDLTAGTEVWVASDFGSSGSMYSSESICWNKFSGHIVSFA